MFDSKVASWLAIVATICFVALIALQVVELSFYGKPPSVWPTP